MRAAAAFLLILPGLLAGCVEQGPVDSLYGVVTAPLWAVGDAWNYTIEDGAGTRLGWVRYAVEAIEPFPGMTDRAYRVRVVHHDPGFVAHGAPDATLTRTVFYDAANLHLIVEGCGLHGKGGPCRDPELDFPLWDNKTWASNTTGDVIIGFENRATFVGSRTMEIRVERVAQGMGWAPRVDVFGWDAGFYRERRIPGGTYAPPAVEPEVWKLQDAPHLPGRQPRAETPSWERGESWNYTIEDRAGTRTGWIRYTVEAIEPVPDISPRAYRVRIERLDYGDGDHDGVPNETLVRTERFDVATLNTVWNDCGRPGGFGECKGRNPDLDFPLWDNKTWNSTSGGDVIVGYRHRATYEHREGAGLWRLERITEPRMQGTEPRVDLFDPWTGFYRERDLVTEVWRLEES